MKWLMLLLVSCCAQPQPKPDNEACEVNQDAESEEAALLKQRVADAVSDAVDLTIQLQKVCLIGCLNKGAEGGYLEAYDRCFCYEKKKPVPQGYKILQWL